MMDLVVAAIAAAVVAASLFACGLLLTSCTKFTDSGISEEQGLGFGCLNDLQKMICENQVRALPHIGLMKGQIWGKH